MQGSGCSFRMTPVERALGVPATESWSSSPRCEWLKESCTPRSPGRGLWVTEIRKQRFRLTAFALLSQRTPNAPRIIPASKWRILRADRFPVSFAMVHANIVDREIAHSASGPSALSTT